MPGWEQDLLPCGESCLCFRPVSVVHLGWLGQGMSRKDVTTAEGTPLLPWSSQSPSPSPMLRIIGEHPKNDFIMCQIQTQDITKCVQVWFVPSLRISSIVTTFTILDNFKTNTMTLYLNSEKLPGAPLQPNTACPVWENMPSLTKAYLFCLSVV